MLSIRTIAFVAVLGITVRSTYSAEPVRPAPPPPPPRKPVESKVILPEVGEAGTPVRTIASQGYRVVLDLAPQSIALHMNKPQSWRSPGEFRPGDVVTVATTSKLSVGTQVQGSVEKGRTLTVDKVEAGWLGVSVIEKGRTLRGWVPQANMRFASDEPPISPTPVGRTDGRFVAAALLVQKAKQFDDGLYAAADLAAQQGAGQFAGKVQLLTKLAQAVAAAPQFDDASLCILTAARLGGLKLAIPADLERRAAAAAASFQGNPLRSKPLGFYTWSPELTRIFQQDRMLQTELSGKAGIETIVKSLAADASSRATYEAYLNLCSRLTNPLVKPGLRPLLASIDAGQSQASAKDLYFFPPSRAHETDLIMRLYGNSPIPKGFSLMDELVKRIKAGQIDLTPSENSGWYDYQTWAIQPLVIPQKMPEGPRVQMNEEYQKHLTELFKGVLALTRETHIKQLEVPAPAAAAGQPEPIKKIDLYVSPELTLEPLPEAYLRRAMSYRFVRGVLEETFGREAVAELHRQTAAGPVAATLAEELREMESLFHGAYVASRLQLGMTPDAEAATGLGQGDQADVAHLLRWAANLDLDSDLATDARMMVPVFYDLQRNQTKVWVFLGWSEQSASCNFSKPPKAQVLDAAGQAVGPERVEVHFISQYEQLMTPVFAELYVKEILNRDEFRRHCDAYKSKTAILANL